MPLEVRIAERLRQLDAPLLATLDHPAAPVRIDANHLQIGAGGPQPHPCTPCGSVPQAAAIQLSLLVAPLMPSRGRVTVVHYDGTTARQVHESIVDVA